MGSTNKISVHASWWNDGQIADLDARCDACGEWFGSWAPNLGPGYGSASLAELNHLSDIHLGRCGSQTLSKGEMK